MAKQIKVIINDDGELQSIYVPKDLQDYKIDVIDYYENHDEAEQQWKELKKDKDMVPLY